MARKAQNASIKDRLSALAARVNKIRDDEENGKRVNGGERDNVRNALGALLIENTDPDMAKRIRRQLRRLGHYISKSGKPWMNAGKKPNRERKATRKANATDSPAADDVTATAVADNTNANANA